MWKPQERTGRPLGSERFVKQLEKTVDRILPNKTRGERKEVKYGVPDFEKY
jgi:hypothetical protein